MNNIKNKLAFVFPGQGAQKSGMGKELSEKYQSSASIMEEADESLGFDLSTLCYEGADEELALTQNTQPALLTVSAMALSAFRENLDIQPDFVAGHSLGEFSAVYASKGLSFKDAVQIVRKRGEYMSVASGGVMAAVLGLDASLIKEACSSVSQGESYIQPANYNGSGQTVIAGMESALEKVTPLLKERGAKRIMPLKVSSAFHTPFMSDASDKLAVDLDNLSFNQLGIPLINNVESLPVTSQEDVRNGLKKQVTGAVRWTEIMDYLIKAGVKTVVEFGSGKTLIGMFKRADRSLRLLNVEDEASLEKTLEALK